MVPPLPLRGWVRPPVLVPAAVVLPMEAESRKFRLRTHISSQESKERQIRPARHTIRRVSHQSQWLVDDIHSARLQVEFELICCHFAMSLS